MLKWSGADAEPSVIGDIEHPSRTLAVRHRLARENDLVANERQEIWRPGRRDLAALVAGDEAALHLCELQKSETLERPETADTRRRHEMKLVVAREQRAVAVDT